jgi:hypothetical protein
MVQKPLRFLEFLLRIPDESSSISFIEITFTECYRQKAVLNADKHGEFCE